MAKRKQCNPKEEPSSPKQVKVDQESQACESLHTQPATDIIQEEPTTFYDDTPALKELQVSSEQPTESSSTGDSKPAGKSSEELEDCGKCKRVLEELEKETHGPLFISMDVDINRISVKKENLSKKEKAEEKMLKGIFLNEIMKRVCALRNCKGGFLVMHISNKSKDDWYLGLFDEMVDEKLEEMIEDDTLFTDNYWRKWHDKYHDILVVEIRPSSSVSTVDFKTKVSTDFSLKRPKARELPIFFANLNARTNPSYIKLNSSPNIANLLKCDSEGFVDLFEDRHTQLKTCQPKATLDYQETNVPLQGNTLAELVEHVWASLKLREYITSFTKIEGGGCYYCGVSEKVHPLPEYSTMKAEVTGMIMGKENIESFKEQLIKKIESCTLWLNQKAEIVGNDQKMKHISISFHEPEATDRLVLCVKVKHFDGLVFFDEKGPVSYAFKDLAKNEERTYIKRALDIIRIDPQRWISLMKKAKKNK